MPGLILLSAVVALLMYGSSAPTGGGGGAFNEFPRGYSLVAPWLFWLVLLVGGVFVFGVMRGKVGLVGILIAGLVVAALIFLNGTDAMPLVDNPCPGDEVIVVINGECMGMDADANRSWLDRMVGP